MVCKMSSFQNMLPSRIGNGCEGQSSKHKEINTRVAAPHRIGGKGDSRRSRCSTNKRWDFSNGTWDRVIPKHVIFEYW